jgi:hypothetical protein
MPTVRRPLPQAALATSLQEHQCMKAAHLRARHCRRPH